MRAVMQVGRPVLHLALLVAIGSSASPVLGQEVPMPRVRGKLTYLQRIALPPDSLAVVQLHDGGDAGALVAEQRIVLAGRQVPIAFDLAIDVAVPSDSGPRRFSASIQMAQRRAWAADPLPVEIGTRDVDLGPVRLTPVHETAERAIVAPQPLLRATGTEPFWSLVVDDRSVTLTRLAQERPWSAPGYGMAAMATGRTYRASLDGRELIARFEDALCRDLMTGMPHPKRVTVRFDGEELQGCGGDPADLLAQAPWRVVVLAGTPLAEGPPVTLQFDPAGRLGGSGGCNGYSTGFTLTGESLTIGQIASTMRACAPPLMARERQFFDLLAGIRSVALGDGGRLVLTSGDGRTIEAVRE